MSNMSLCKCDLCLALNLNANFQAGIYWIKVKNGNTFTMTDVTGVE